MGKKGPPRCDPCKKAKHDDCVHVFCHCFCMSPSIPYLGVRSEVPQPERDLTHVLALMRNESVVSRTKRGPLPEVVYAPAPRRLSEHLQTVLREHRLDLTRVLLAWHSPLPWSRPYWTTGSIDACYGCGRSCAAIDPLGVCRHTWCGWVGQKREVIRMVAAPMYPNMSTGSAVFSKPYGA